MSVRLLSAAIFALTLSACIALDAFALLTRLERWLERKRDERQWIAYLDRADAERRALAPRVLPGPQASPRVSRSVHRLAPQQSPAAVDETGPGNPPTNWRK